MRADGQESDWRRERRASGQLIANPISIKARRRIALQAVKRFKERLRELTRRKKGISLEEMVKQLTVYLRGRQEYFSFCQTPSVLQSFDKWVRHR